MLGALTDRFSTGTLVSGAGHLAIILWVILGGTLFRSSIDPVPATTNVTLVSEAAFEGREATRPEVITEVPDAPQPAPVAEAPAPPPPPAETPEPEVPEVSAPAPQAPPPPPPPADRVAPVPVPQPPEEAQIAETPQEATTPDGAGSEAAEPQEAEAPEAATTRIITEATETDPESRSEEIALAPVTTPRPQARPNRPVRQPDPEPQPETPPDPIANAVAEAVAEASDTPPAADPTLPVGPPMTSSEREGLRVAVQQCWNTGSLSSEALRTTVTVGVQMEQDGRPNVGSIRMIDAEGGSDAATQQAYEAARRAIIRCGARGFDLPVEKYAQWRDIEMTFNPERMRIR